MLDIMTNEDLYEHLLNGSRVLTTPTLKEAFRAIDRKNFVPDDYAVEAYEDYPLPIGFEQTISQPTTVAFMLELLDIKGGESVLDVGSGSGWTTALLAFMVGPQGNVIGIERIPELVIFGDANLKKCGISNAEIMTPEKGFGKKGKLFDRILVSAEAEALPDELVEQLKPGGVMVIPVKDAIIKVVKESKGTVTRKEFPGFMFVPLIKE